MDARVLAGALTLLAMGSSACSTRSLEYLSRDFDKDEQDEHRAEPQTATPAAKSSSLVPTENVFADLEYPAMLVVDGDSLYWVEQGPEKKIVTSKKNGADRHPVVLALEPPPVELAVDPDDGGLVYWADSAGAVHSAPKRGVGGASQVKLVLTARPVGKAVSLTFDRESIYAALYDQSGAYGSIVKIPKTGGAAIDVVTSSYPKAVVTHGDRLFWFSASEDSYDDGTAFALKPSAPEQYGDVEALKGVLSRRFAVSGDAFFTASEDALARMPMVPDATPRIAKVDGLRLKAIAVDDQFVWACDAMGRIVRQRKDWSSTTPDVVAEGIGVPTSIVADADGVWFTAEGPTSNAPGSLVKILR